MRDNDTKTVKVRADENKHCSWQRMKAICTVVLGGRSISVGRQ